MFSMKFYVPKFIYFTARPCLARLKGITNINISVILTLCGKRSGVSDGEDAAGRTPDAEIVRTLRLVPATSPFGE